MSDLPTTINIYNDYRDPRNGIAPLVSFPWTWGSKPSLSEVLKRMFPEPRHLMYAGWKGDGLIYSIVTDKWVSEPHGHEPGPSTDPTADLAQMRDAAAQRLADIDARIWRLEGDE